MVRSCQHYIFCLCVGRSFPLTSCPWWGLRLVSSLGSSSYLGWVQVTSLCLYGGPPTQVGYLYWSTLYFPSLIFCFSFVLSYVPYIPPPNYECPSTSSTRCGSQPSIGSYLFRFDWFGPIGWVLSIFSILFLFLFCTILYLYLFFYFSSTLCSYNPARTPPARGQCSPKTVS